MGFNLEHNVWTLVGYLVTFVLGVSAAASYRPTWWAWLPLLAGLLWLIFIDFRQSVLYRDGIVIWSPFRRPSVSIKISDITVIKKETTFWQLNARGYLAICDEQHNKKVRVSLALFTAHDILKLMRIIHESRPDLAIPEGWIMPIWRLWHPRFCYGFS